MRAEGLRGGLDLSGASLRGRVGGWSGMRKREHLLSGGLFADAGCRLAVIRAILRLMGRTSEAGRASASFGSTQARFLATLTAAFGIGFLGRTGFADLLLLSNPPDAAALLRALLRVRCEEDAEDVLRRYINRACPQAEIRI